MNETEQEENPTFDISLCASTDFTIYDQCQFNGGYLYGIFMMNLGWIKYVLPFLLGMLLTTISISFFHVFIFSLYTHPLSFV